jgi:hypothetical protein
MCVVGGALVAIVGSSYTGEVGHKRGEILAGDVVAFLGALGGVSYVENGKKLRQEVLHDKPFQIDTECDTYAAF